MRTEFSVPISRDQHLIDKTMRQDKEISYKQISVTLLCTKKIFGNVPAKVLAFL